MPRRFTAPATLSADELIDAFVERTLAAAPVLADDQAARLAALLSDEEVKA